MANRNQDNNVTQQLLQVITGYAKQPNTENLQTLLSMLESTQIDNADFSSLINSSKIDFSKISQSERQRLEHSLEGFQNRLSDIVLNVETRYNQEVARIAFLKEQSKVKKSNIKSHENSPKEAVIDIQKEWSHLRNELNFDKHSELKEQQYEKEVAVKKHLQFQGMAQMLLEKIENSNSHGVSKNPKKGK